VPGVSERRKLTHRDQAAIDEFEKFTRTAFAILNKFHSDRKARSAPVKCAQRLKTAIILYGDYGVEVLAKRSEPHEKFSGD
jgi:hypothetical protein